MYIRSIGMRINTTKDNPCMEIIREVCEQDELKNGLKPNIRTYEFLMTAVISYLGNIGDYESSDELGIKLLTESLLYRREVNLAEYLYNKLWNYQQRLLEGKIIRKVYEEEKELRRCLLLSKFDNKEKFIIFFEQLLMDHKNKS